MIYLFLIIKLSHSVCGGCCVCVSVRILTVICFYCTIYKIFIVGYKNGEFFTLPISKNNLLNRNEPHLILYLNQSPNLSVYYQQCSPTTKRENTTLYRWGISIHSEPNSLFGRFSSTNYFHYEFNSTVPFYNTKMYYLFTLHTKGFKSNSLKTQTRRIPILLVSICTEIYLN